MGEQEERMDPADGLPAMPVGEWTQDKYALLKLYIEITRAVRGKFIGRGKAGATFIDLFCASGRAYIRGTNRFIDGSPIVAWKASAECNTPFSVMHINDNAPALLDAASARLRALGAPVIKHGGAANDVVQALVPNLDPYALHFALIDPFGLTVPFTMLQALATLKRMDLLIHVSAMDLQRNWSRYAAMNESPLDEIAPGWRVQVDLNQAEESARLSFIRYWVSQLEKLGFGSDVRFELITGSNGQPLYWLVLLAKHDIAMQFWKKATQHGKTRDLF